MVSFKRNRILSVMLDRSNVIIALKMSLIVGTILNCINQPECIFNLDIEKLQVGKFFITYTVPFFVSLYTSTIIKLRADN